MSNPEIPLQPESQTRIRNAYSDLDKNPEASSEQTYTADQVAGIVFESFRLSQGEEFLQEDFLEYFSNKFSDRLSGFTDFDEVKKLLTAKITKWLQAGMHRVVTEQEIQETIATELQELAAAITRPRLKPSTNVDAVMIQDMVNLDPQEHRSTRLRTATTTPTIPHPANPQTSYLVLYGFMNRTTGVVEVDEYYKDCVEQLTAQDDGLSEHDAQERVRKLRLILSIHLQAHPQSIDQFTETAKQTLDKLLGADWQPQLTSRSDSADTPQ